MDDKELLELAAKAAGIAITQCTCRNENYPFRHDESVSGKYGHWNPLLNDGDALRLAVQLRLMVDLSEEDIEVVAYLPGRAEVTSEADNGDRNWCARRAIVRAAAEIARQENSNDR